MKDFPIHVDDLIFVSVEKELKLTKQGKEVATINIPAGIIKELAILNANKTHFILLSEYEEKKVRPVKSYVSTNLTGEYEFEKPNATKLSEEQKKFGVKFSWLRQINGRSIKGQIFKHLKTAEATRHAEKKLSALTKSREQYLNF